MQDPFDFEVCGFYRFEMFSFIQFQIFMLSKYQVLGVRCSLSLLRNRGIKRSISFRTIYFKYQRHKTYQQTSIHGEDRWVIEINNSSNIWQTNRWFKIEYLRDNQLHHSSVCQIFDLESSVYLSVRYSLLNHLSNC